MPAQVRAICLGVCGGVGVRACMCVWVRAWKPVNVCVMCASVRSHVRARAGDYECRVFVFQCASVSLCFV